jgi:hypothetical protein
MPTEETAIPLNGLSLDDVWNNIVATIGGLDTHSEETIEEQIINREQHEKLLRQIEQLEKRCRAEKQTRKRYELRRILNNVHGYKELSQAFISSGFEKLRPLPLAISCLASSTIRKNSSLVKSVGSASFSATSPSW